MYVLYVWSRNNPRNEIASIRISWTVNHEVKFLEGQLQIRHIAPETKESTLQLLSVSCGLTRIYYIWTVDLLFGFIDMSITVCVHDIVRVTSVSGGGVHQSSPRQKWHISCLLSQFEHNGVIWPSAHCSSGNRSTARHQSQKRPVIKPQSTHGLQSISGSPQASTPRWGSIAITRARSMDGRSAVVNVCWFETEGYKRTILSYFSSSWLCHIGGGLSQRVFV